MMRIIFVACLCVLLHACSSIPSDQQATLDFITTTKSQAIKAAADERLSESLTYWQIIHVLLPGDVEVEATIKGLKKKITSKTRQYNLRGDAAYNAGSTRRARSWYLKVLALSPGHDNALDKLGKIQSLVVRAQQDKKSDKENNAYVITNAVVTENIDYGLPSLFTNKQYQEVINKSLLMSIAPEGELLDMIFASHLHVVNVALKRGAIKTGLNQLAETEKLQLGAPITRQKKAKKFGFSLSDMYYKSGLKIIQTDIDLAITAFEKAIEYDVTNSRAQVQLFRVTKMRDNLIKIKRLQKK